MLLRHAEIAGRPRAGEPVYDCQGGAVLPGLCDHHLRLHAMPAWAGSVRCGPPEVTGPAALAEALAAAGPDSSGWIRGTGYAETVAGDLDAPALDRLRADRPVRAVTGRRTASGEVAGPGERITFAQALDACLAPPGDRGGPPRRAGPGRPGDLVVLRAPLAQAARLPDPVRAVLVNGTIAVEKELSG